MAKANPICLSLAPKLPAVLYLPLAPTTTKALDIYATAFSFKFPAPTISPLVSHRLQAYLRARAPPIALNGFMS